MRKIDRLAEQLMDNLVAVVEDFYEENADAYMLSVNIDVQAPPKPKRVRKDKHGQS